MANSKHAHYRYNILNKLFRRRFHPLTFCELFEVVNEKIGELYSGESITIRTLRSDIRLFRESKNGFGAPLTVQKEKGKEVYFYTDPNFSIAQKKLLPYEQYLIDASQQLLERFEEDSKYDKLSEALVLFQDQEGVLSVPNYDKILFYDKNEAYEGLSHLKPFFLAIKEKKVLNIVFKGFNNDKTKEYIFHPYVLKQYNQRWFVFGYNQTDDITEWSIPLDERLKQFDVNEEIELIKDNNDWTSFFNQMVGIRKQSITQESPDPEIVVLKFHPSRLQYFKTKPIHPYWDEFAEQGKKNQVFFETIINLELVQQILSYGKDVQVIEPKSLKIKMKEHAKTMQKFYS